MRDDELTSRALATCTDLLPDYQLRPPQVCSKIGPEMLTMSVQIVVGFFGSETNGTGIPGCKKQS
jgi:hypothetical protein